ncbi:MAG: LptA/OstA family protein [bacterium]
MKLRIFLFRILSIAITFAILCVSVFAATEASIKAKKLTLDENETGAILTLEGPVEINYGDEHLTAKSATVELKKGASNLADAILKANLSGDVNVTAQENVKAHANEVIFEPQIQKLTMSGKVRIDRDNFSVTANEIAYIINKTLADMTGGVTLTDGSATVTAESGSYNIKSRSGKLEGKIEVIFPTENLKITDKPVDKIVITCGMLDMSLNDERVTTGLGQSNKRSKLEAGNMSVQADKITYEWSPSEKNSGSEKPAYMQISVHASGKVVFAAPDVRVEADSIAFSNSDGKLTASGNVKFSVLGQKGEANEIEVNFAEGWTVRLKGATVGGSLEGQ